MAPSPGPGVRVLSSGGGLDSFALLVEAIGRGTPPDLVVFADVTDPEGKDPGEWAGTYRHLRDVVAPLCWEEGIDFHWLGTGEIPIRGERSLFKYFETKRLMPGRQSRLCTSAAKVERVTEYLERRYPTGPIEVWLGFEAGEEKRAANDPHAKGRAKGRRTNRFPLIEWGLCRCRCERLVRRAGFPVPRKSACMFCPFGTRGDFQRLRDEQPEVFARLEALEANARLTKSGHVIRFGSRKRGGKETYPTLRQWVEPDYTRRQVRCEVCGTIRATKAAGCDYLADDEAVDPELPRYLV